MGLARRLAAGALQRLAREVDRLSHALEPIRAAIPLREPGRASELEVSRRVEAPASPGRGVRQAPARSSASAAEPATVVTIEPEPSTSAAPPAADEAEPPLVVTAEPAASPPAAPVRASEPAASVGEEPPPRAEPVVVPPLELRQVAHLREAIEPQLAFLRDGVGWEHADDPAAALHRMRVATRRLRAFVRLFAPVIGDKRTRRLQQRLRAITRGLGPVREHDVLIEALRAEHDDAAPLARAALEHVLGWVRAQRRKAARRAVEALAELDVTALATALDAELDRVCGRLLRRSEQLPALASVWLEPELARALEGMPRPREETDLDGLHDVRIRAKRLRYALELLQPALCASEPGAPVTASLWSLRKPLKRVQSTVGDHRDGSQLAERLRERREALAREGLHTLASALEPVEAAVARRRQRAFEHAMRALEALDADPRVPRSGRGASPE